MTRHVNIPEYAKRPKEAGELWTLRKDGRLATCHLWTPPLRGEVRVTVDGELVRSEARRERLALVEPGLEWKAQFGTRGWIP